MKNQLKNTSYKALQSIILLGVMVLYVAIMLIPNISARLIYQTQINFTTSTNCYGLGDEFSTFLKYDLSNFSYINLMTNKTIINASLIYNVFDSIGTANFNISSIFNETMKYQEPDYINFWKFPKDNFTIISLPNSAGVAEVEITELFKRTWDNYRNGTLKQNFTLLIKKIGTSIPNTKWYDIYFYAGNIGGTLREFKKTYFYINVSISFDYIFENSQIYNSSTYETYDENFVLNMTYNSTYYSSISANLIYNGSSYLGTKEGTDNNINFSRSLIIPNINLYTENKSFYWEIILTNSTGNYYANSTLKNQTIYKLPALSFSVDCITQTSPALNFTFAWEKNLTATNASANVIFIYGYAGNITAYSINTTFVNKREFYLCINNSQPYYNISYGEVQYYFDGYSDRRYYAFSNSRITNITQKNYLHLLETASSTSFLFTAQSTTLSPYTNKYIAILRWYPELNYYRVIEMGKTDDKGQTLLKIKVEDSDYRIAVYEPDGTLIKLFSAVRFVCQTTPCTYSLYIETGESDLSSFSNIDSSLTWNNNTKVFTFIWSDPTQTTTNMNLTIYKDTSTSSIPICSSSGSGFVGVLTCNVSTYSGILRAVAYRSASPQNIIQQVVVEIRQTLIDIAGGKSLILFFNFVLLVFFGLLGIISPPLAIIMTIIALIPALLLGGINFIILMGIVTLGGIILHFLRRTQ